MTVLQQRGTPIPGGDVLASRLADALADPTRVSTRMLDRLACGHDASHFALTPRAVARPVDAVEMGRLFAVAADEQVPLTLRSGGTSLSGQAVTDGILVDTRRHFRGVEVLDDGARVRVGPGSTVRQVNAMLAGYGRKLGPDPASEGACTLGGVVANNSSGMACGTVANAYQTLDSMVLVLASGTVIDTGATDADQRLAATEPDLHAGLLRLRERVRDDPESRRTVEAQFAMKNTMGYGLNSLLDHDTPVKILEHLVIGSEGTLGFVAAVVMRTVPLLTHVRTGLLVFEDLAGATGALPAIRATEPATIELLDETSLRVAQHLPAADERLRSIQVHRHAALLVEFQGDSDEAVSTVSNAAGQVLDGLPLATAAELTDDAAVRARLWRTRKDLYATVAGARPTGTTALLEDIVVPVPALLETCEQLHRLFDRHGYENAVIFGHAKDGNVHFMLTERLGSDEPPERFLSFTENLVDLVLGQGGSLKAEHGTGRMMAPYVRRQYGDELYAVMREIKQLCDPRGMLNPGVIITDDESAHVRDLKVTRPVDPIVDRCVECGYCEPVCPSKDLTLTPRQRIAVQRDMVLLEEDGQEATLAELAEDYTYDGEQTCAADGMCQTACPVQINTGVYVKQRRAESAGKAPATVWHTAARHWSATTRAAAVALTAAETLPSALTESVSRASRRVLDPDLLPGWTSDLPRGGAPRSAASQAQVGGTGPADAVYFVACVGAMFGPGGGGAGVQRSFEALCERAGITLRVPETIDGLCCGTPWRSKGMTQGFDTMSNRVLPALWRATEGGRLPVVVDASSCTEGLVEMLEHHQEHPPVPGRPSLAGLTFVDSIVFVRDRVMPELAVRRQLSSIALHPTCSSTRLGSTPALAGLAALVADDVTIPKDWGCCAFAGDRGMLHPELTASATARESAEIRAGQFDAYASCNRTCEIGISRATGQDYQHLLEIVDWATAAEVR